MPQWSFINEKHYANLIFQRITYKSYIFGPCPKTVVHSGCWRLRFPWFPVWNHCEQGFWQPPSYDESVVVAAICWWIIMILKKHMYICLMDRDDSEHISQSRNIYHSLVAYLMFTDEKHARTSRWVPGLKFHPSVPVNSWCQFGFHGTPRQLVNQGNTLPQPKSTNQNCLPWNSSWTWPVVLAINLRSEKLSFREVRNFETAG